GGREVTRLLLDVGNVRLRSHWLFVRLNQVRATEHRAVGTVAMKDPVTQLVTDCEAAAWRPLTRLCGVHPDFAASRQEQARERLVGLELGRSWRDGEVLDVANQEAVAARGDLLDRN